MFALDRESYNRICLLHISGVITITSEVMQPNIQNEVKNVPSYLLKFKELHADVYLFD